MAKLFTYIIILYGILLLLSLAGLPTGASDILAKLGLDTNSGAIDTTVFYGLLLGLGAAAVGIGIALSRLTNTPADLYLAGIFGIGSILPLAVGFSNLITLSANYSDWINIIVIAFVGILSLGYLLAVVDWILQRGNN